MEPQKILADLDKAIEQRWGHVEQCPCHAQLYQIASDIQQAKPQIKKLKKNKQDLSRKFSDKSLSIQALDNLKQEVGNISATIKSAESKLKQQLAELSTLFTPSINKHLEFPERFQKLYKETNPPEIAKITITCIDDSFAKHWDDYVRQHPGATLYHYYRWKHFIETSHQVPGIYLAAFDIDQSCVGVLPLFNIQSRLFGNYLISIPYFNYAGPLADTAEIESALLEQAALTCQQQGAEYVEIRATHSINSWSKKTEKASMVLALPDTHKEFDSQLGSKLRAQIKQASQHDLQTMFGGVELLDDFYDVFAENMRDLGTPVYGKYFFTNLLADFQHVATIAVVYRHKKPVATGFLLKDKDTVEIPWASTLRSHNRFNANMFLYKAILDHVIESGYSYFDFGRSTINAPTYKFKKQWGAKPVQHYWHYWLPEGNELPMLNPNNPKYRLIIKIWQKLPVWLTKVIGPKIVKHLP